MVPVESDPTGQGPPADTGPDVEVGARRWRVMPWWGWLLSALGLLVAAGISLALVKVPYVALAPGQATAVGPLIEVPSDARADAAAADGDVLFTTVSVRRLSALEWAWAQMNGDIEVVPEEVVYGSLTPDENREINLALMDSSKEVAVYVAMDRLGLPVELAEGGAVVVDVAADLPAAEVLEVGDVIVSADSTPIHIPEQLREVTARFEPGDVVELVVVPQGAVEGGGGPARTVEVELGAREDGGALIGVVTQPSLTLEILPPFSIDIDSGTVGGPSAGLAFTLALMDVLTPGSLTGGEIVGVTGTIDLTGRVGPVGGVRQKTMAARNNGAVAMIVPRDELAAAEPFAGDMTLIPVDDLDDALAGVAELGGDLSALEQLAAA